MVEEWAPTPWGRPTVMVEPEAATESQGEAEDPEGQGGAGVFSDRGVGGAPEGRGGAGATED